jgi:hypothetical protein
MKAEFSELLAKQKEFRAKIRRGERKPLKRTHFAVMCERGYAEHQAKLKGQDAALPPGDRE